MPSTREQKATKNRSRQSDVMSDIEILDVLLGSYQRDNRSYLNTNLGENCGLTVQTSRALSSEISSQMSKKVEEKKTDSNTRISDN